MPARIGTTDITAAVLHTLIDVYNNIAVRRPAGLTVQFHLDYEDAQVRVTSQRNAGASVTIMPKIPDNLLVRVPGWTPPGSVKFVSGGKAVTPTILKNLAFFRRDQIDGQLVMTYDLPQSTTEETVDGTAYTFHWRGDEITGISPNSEFLPFYPTAP